jgi:hypothetical protein
MPESLASITQSAEEIAKKAAAKSFTIKDAAALIAQLAKNQVIIGRALQDHMNDRGEHWR